MPAAEPMAQEIVERLKEAFSGHDKIDREALNRYRSMAGKGGHDMAPINLTTLSRLIATIDTLESALSTLTNLTPSGVERLRKAAQRVLDGLNARIDAADLKAVPVFDGIAELHAALALPSEPPSQGDVEGRAREIEPAYRDAVALADALWRTHYYEQAPNWKPLPDLRGVISQIDNMTAGMTLASKEGGRP